MNTDFIVDGLENFANWGGPIADIFEALGDIFGEKGLGALEGADTDNGDDAGEGSSLVELSSGLSSEPADGETVDE